MPNETETITSADVGSLDSIVKKDSTVDKFKALLDAINAESAPLRSKRDELADKIRPTEDEIRDLNQKIKEIEQPAKGEAERIITALS